MLNVSKHVSISVTYCYHILLSDNQKDQHKPNKDGRFK